MVDLLTRARAATLPTVRLAYPSSVRSVVVALMMASSDCMLRGRPGLRFPWLVPAAESAFISYVEIRCFFQRGTISYHTLPRKAPREHYAGAPCPFRCKAAVPRTGSAPARGMSAGA